ncbi:MAG: right-handed parallel beta-helix repeat-containing protein [Proteobacteria bacterium]|nr:right-handed parallel beta-helix repeat-containing protein [Pseudomonadota bacterium]MBU4294929.1 right-handed parallel beta-helix repeat-containing protein [Pseudomonadota bacterium]MCG2745923.1 right-handed parallel beta-helix repeat-containing protein [Desulfobulbaceae bacterium]
MKRTRYQGSIVFFLGFFFCVLPRLGWSLSTTCNSCLDCTTKLNSGTWDEVTLSTDIIDHEGGCIYIDSDDVIFDCAGNRVDGDGLDLDPEDGIFIGHSTDVTVRNCLVSDFSIGIHLFDTTSSVVTTSEVYGNTNSGIDLSTAMFNVISTNNVHDNTQGIVFYSASSNSVFSNTVCGNNPDFNIYSGTGNSGYLNACNEPDGWNDDGYTGCSTMCAGTTTCSSCSGCTAKLNGDYDTVILTANIWGHSGTCISFGTNDTIFDCNGHTIDGDDSGIDYGVSIVSRSGNTVRDCTISDFYNGIHLNNASSNTLHNNHSLSNTNHGIRLEESDYNTIGNYNLLTSNAVYGLSLLHSHNNDIFFNTVRLNLTGGIRLDESSRNDIGQNTVEENQNTDSYGITLYGGASGTEFNYVTGNQVVNNYYGILLDDAYSNYINSNTVCSSMSRDIRQIGTFANAGDLNTCDFASSWDDNGRTDCTFRCSKCTDGIQNYDEEGVDCGGMYCPSCADCDTSAKYGPPDSDCRNPWNNGEGPAVDINTRDASCDLFEVCDPNLDYIVEDALECCENEDYLTVITGDHLSGRREACSYAHDNSYDYNFQDNFNALSLKECVGRYIIKAFGQGAVYMQGYFSGEFCCYGSDKFCGESTPDCPYWQTKPFAWEMGTPDSCSHRVEETPDFDMGGHHCEYNYFLWWEWGEPGYWHSDTGYTSNNDSKADLPAHASINKLSTGTCVDYAISTATMLRKAGYLENEVYAVDGDGHDYNLVRFPDYAKWYYTDTTGNRGSVKGDPDFHCCKGIPDSCDLITNEDPCNDAEGCSWSGGVCTGTPEDGACSDAFWSNEADCTATSGCSWEVCYYDYCRSLDQGCYNDNMSPSRDNCPPNDEIHGCEGIDATSASTISVSAPVFPTSSSAESVSAEDKVAAAEASFLSIDGECTELNPCTGENMDDVQAPPPAVNLNVTKEINDARILLGEEVQVKVTVKSYEKVKVFVRVQENFIPGVHYIGLDPEEEMYESLRVLSHTWPITLLPGETRILTFEVEPQSLGLFSLSSTLVAAGNTILKATCPSIEVRCDPDGVCSLGENALYCKDDCPGGAVDGVCDRQLDGIDDPDCPYGIDPDYNDKADTDGDSVMNFEDDCPLTGAGMKADSNGCACNQKSCDDGNDSTLDRCSNSTGECYYLIDADRDGVADGKDNCPGVFNPDQRDSDKDGIGDQCEIGVITKDTVLDKGIYYINDYEKKGAVRFGASKVSLDCNGSIIIGNGSGYGIYLPSSYGMLTIKNCTLRNYEYGIYLDKSGENQLLRNTLEQNSVGIILGGAGKNKLEQNDANTNARAGISLDSSTDNILSANKMTKNGAGILLQTTSDNDVSNNYVCENTYSDFYEYSSINSGTGNTCDNPDGWSDDATLGCTSACPNIKCEGDLDCDGDTDGLDLAHYIENTATVLLRDLADDFGRTDCTECLYP